jgi:hypothetical protein
MWLEMPLSDGSTLPIYGTLVKYAFPINRSEERSQVEITAMAVQYTHGPGMKRNTCNFKSYLISEVVVF